MYAQLIALAGNSRTIVTYIMEAIQLKLDKLIQASQGTYNALLDLKVLERENLDAFKLKYQALTTAAHAELIWHT